MVTFLRRGGISILEALSVKLPDVFAAEILPKLEMKDTLSLAQVNKAYNAAVWSADGVRSMEAKIKAHFGERAGSLNRCTGRQSTATCPRSGPALSPGRTLTSV